jgi:hypothetical protein
MTSFRYRLQQGYSSSISVAARTLNRQGSRFVFRAVTAVLGLSTALASWDYGDGRHGSFVLTTSMPIEQLYQTVGLPIDPLQYDPSDTNAIPNFQNLTITNGASLTANPWDGTTGGRVVLKVQASLSVAPGSSISVGGDGYRGGGPLQQGESYPGVGSLKSAAKPWRGRRRFLARQP